MLDKGEIGLDIDMPAITVEEGASGSYTISALSRPSTSTGDPGTVSVAITSNNADVTVSPNPVVLNSSNWADGVAVTVRAAEDADGVNDVVTLSHVATSTSGGQAGDYDGAGSAEGEPIQDVTVTVEDDDPPMVVFEETPVTVTEGGTKVYKVKLATEPTDTVTVTINDPTDNSDVTTEPSTLTFNASNYGTGQNVTVSAASDVNTTDATATVTHSAAQSGGSSEYDGRMVDDVAVTVTDPDRAGLRLNPSNALLTVQEEGTVTYQIWLTHQPASNVTVTFALTRLQPTSGSTLITFDADSGTSGDQAALSFTDADWDTMKTVAVRGVADANLVDERFRITHSISGTRTDSGSDVVHDYNSY